MDKQKIQLAVCWICLMLIYLLGDVLRVYEKGQGAAVIDGKSMDQKMFLLAALMMLLPILMAIVSVFGSYGLVRWGSIAVSAVLFLINVAGVHSYSSPYDRMQIILSLAPNLFVIGVAWSWKAVV